MGWVRIDRSLSESDIWLCEPFSKGQAWVDLILLANYKDTKLAYKGEIVICKRGDVNLSISKLAERWQWSRHKVRDFLKILEADNMCTVKSSVHRTVITLVNYGKYQDIRTTDGTVKRTTKGQQKDITNKDNKVNKYNNKFCEFERNIYDFQKLEEQLNKEN